MSVEDLERIKNIKYDEGVVKNIIVDSLIERSRAGEIEWDFSNIEDNFCMFPITTEVEGIRFTSYQEQGSGIRLHTFREKEGMAIELIEEFSLYDAKRLREALEELASENPVVIQIRKELEEKRQRDREEGARKAAEKLEELIKIALLLKGKE